MNTQEINNVQYIAVSTIKTSRFNPRKTFQDTELSELAESIMAQGMLQPIMVRPTDEGFEIVYGERRYKATLLAGIDTVPALVRELSDQQVMEVALTENLHRADVSPIEEATAYKQLMEYNGYDTALLMQRFGKSEQYIRNRMRLNALLEPFAELLLSEEISLNVALELCKYSHEVQQEIFEQHYATENSYQNWLNKGAKEVARMIEQSYSTDLNEYFFGKEECYNCQFNTDTHHLFAEGNGCGKCLNAVCLKRKNVEYIVSRAIATHESNPELPLVRNEYRYCADAVDILTNKEYEITVISHCHNCPIPPTEPQTDEYETDEEFAEAQAGYEEELMEYQTKSAELCEKYERGEIAMYAHIGTRGVSLGYMNSNTGNTQPVETPLVKLTKQDERNSEIKREKIVGDTKELIQETDLCTSEFSVFEERLTYFAMLKYLRRESYEKVGVVTENGRYHFLTDEDRMQIVNNLTEQAKDIIRRDFILNTLKEAFRDGVTAELLMEFAKQHAPDKLNEISEKHQAVYDKRHIRIMEKITAIGTIKEDNTNDEIENNAE